MQSELNGLIVPTMITGTTEKIDFGFLEEDDDFEEFAQEGKVFQPLPIVSITVINI